MLSFEFGLILKCYEFVYVVDKSIVAMCLVYQIRWKKVSNLNISTSWCYIFRCSSIETIFIQVYYAQCVFHCVRRWWENAIRVKSLGIFSQIQFFFSKWIHWFASRLASSYYLSRWRSCESHRVPFQLLYRHLHGWFVATATLASHFSWCSNDCSQLIQFPFEGDAKFLCCSL